MSACRRLLSVAACSGILLAAAGPVRCEDAPSYVSFDLPLGCGTPAPASSWILPLSINAHGAVAGYSRHYIECNPEGFVREPGNGVTTEFVAPDAARAIGGSTVVTAINAQGEITGYVNIGGVDYPGQVSGVAFLRTADGAFTSFTFSSGGEAVSNTIATDINGKGEITGSYPDSTNRIRGFVRSAAGAFTPFAASGPPGSQSGTFPIAINDAGTIAGSVRAGAATHGFVRDAYGTISLFDAPGASATTPAAMNESGVIVGASTGASGMHGFLRDASGHIAVFDVPGSSTGTTSASGINLAGAITGTFSDARGNHGFLRTPAGQFVPLDFPGAPASGNCAFGPCGTYPARINDAGEITGYYRDSRGQHGFLLRRGFRR